MCHAKRSPLTFCFAVALGVALVLAPMDTGHGRIGGHKQPSSGQEKSAQQRGRSAEHRADPCSEEHPPGNAFGLRRRCVPEGSSAGVARGDFNADGFADLAIGAPLHHFGSIADAGAVYVQYGTSNGLLATGDQIWTQDSPEVLDAPEEFDEFGFALASGDFNGDGFKDLAVGVPFEDTGTNNQNTDVGAVNILNGSVGGLTGTGGPLLTVASEAGALYGRALTSWNFGNGPQADLAIGAPFKDVGVVVDAGAVYVQYGSASGLTIAGSQLWTQDSPNILDVAETDDEFGRALY